MIDDIYKELIKAAEGLTYIHFRTRIALFILGVTGIRINELLTLKVNQIDFKLLKQKQHLMTLLCLLTYVKKLKYTTKSLTSEFIRSRLPLHDFLNYNNLTSNYYQIKEA